MKIVVGHVYEQNDGIVVMVDGGCRPFPLVASKAKNSWSLLSGELAIKDTIPQPSDSDRNFAVPKSLFCTAYVEKDVVPVWTCEHGIQTVLKRRMSSIGGTSPL